MSLRHSIDLTRLPVANLLSIFTDTITAISNTVIAAADRTQILPETNALAAARAPMDVEFLTSRSSMNTPLVAAADMRRDDSVYCISGVTRGFSFSSNPARKAAAQRILHYLDAYGAVASLDYTAESAAISSLLADLQGVVAAEIATLGLTTEVTELSNAQAAFKTAFDARDAENPNAGDDPTLTELRPAAEAAFKTLIDRVAALHVSSRGAAPWPAALGIINNIIDRYNDLLARRGGGSNAPATPPGI